MEMQHAKAPTLTELCSWIKATWVGSAKYLHLGKDRKKQNAIVLFPYDFISYYIFCVLVFYLIFACIRLQQTGRSIKTDRLETCAYRSG